MIRANPPWTDEAAGHGRQARVAVVGAGPAGMSAALLLARAGHTVTLFELSTQAGGLWASELDESGCFVADNSCKVYQGSYHSTPALFDLLGTRWEDHFLARHDLYADWLQPFLRACTLRDLRLLGGGLLSAGLGRSPEISVGDFLERLQISEPCRDWMRATALGGITGTLRMTMWELQHRVRSNLSSILSPDDGILYWNAQPPNLPGGFVHRWVAELAALGVELRLETAVTSVRPASGGLALEIDGSGPHETEAVFLAVPPPALARLLTASPASLVAGFGHPADRLGEIVSASRYEHLGITWFFDQPLSRDLPLGGHNVRRGWHPILVQHDQYRPHLRPGEQAVVVGSISLDTDLPHHRLGGPARDHAPEALARILWEDEQLVDPSLPDPVRTEIAGLSSATQIIHHGPLHLRCAGAPLYLATSLNGRAPYFTASLESAIQAGAAAALAFDPNAERLPTTAPLGGLRRFAVESPLPASAEEAWEVFLDTARWPKWGRMVPSARGDLVAGSRWEIETVREGGRRSLLQPILLRLRPPRELVFRTEIGGGHALRLDHRFRFEAVGPDRSILRQSWEVRGLVLPLAWGAVTRELSRWSRLGEDLAHRLAPTEASLTA